MGNIRIGIKMIKRRKTRPVKIGNISIGENNPIAVQSMTNTDTSDIESTVSQILELEKAGCDIVRSSIPDIRSALAVKEIKKHISIPIVGDIHFDHELALAAIENGIDKIRINPGNIGGKIKTKEVISACRKANIPVRIGVNSGSLDKKFLAKHNGVTPEAMAESMSEYIGFFLEEDFFDLVLSLKSSDVMKMTEAYRIISSRFDYPMHLGVTEAGSVFTGAVKSAVGLGILLAEGIGDTIRVSLTGDVKKEILAGRTILRSLGYSMSGINLISCPTCARTRVGLEDLVEKLENKLSELTISGQINVAVMGCAVNGPGEAREADIGIAGGDGEYLLFKKGVIVRKVAESDVLKVLFDEIGNFGKGK